MESETNFIYVNIGILLVTMLGVWLQKTEALSSTKRRLRPISHPQEPVPPMGRINVPCDPELLDQYVKALSRAHVKFLPPAEPEPPMPYPSGSCPSSDRCFILVAEEDSQRAEQVIAEVNRKFYL
jgi:hypothetical protein